LSSKIEYPGSNFINFRMISNRFSLYDNKQYEEVIPWLKKSLDVKGVETEKIKALLADAYFELAKKLDEDFVKSTAIGKTFDFAKYLKLLKIAERLDPELESVTEYLEEAYSKIGEICDGSPETLQDCKDNIIPSISDLFNKIENSQNDEDDLVVFKILMKYLPTEKYDQNKWKFIVKAVLVALKHDPNNFELMMKLKIAYNELNQGQDHLKTLEKLHELNPNNVQVLQELQMEYTDTKNKEKRLEIIRKLIKLDPGYSILLDKFYADYGTDTPEPTPALKERIHQLKGDVKIKRASSGETQKLGSYSTIYPGDIIIAGKDGQVNVVDPAGNNISIRPNTEFQFIKLDSQKSTFELIKGDVYTFFKKNLCLSCKVVTPVAIAAVRATEFVTTHTEGITVFDLKEGTLQVTNLADGEVILVNSGNTVTVDNFATYVKPLTDEQWNTLTDDQDSAGYDDQGDEYYGDEVYSGFDGPDGTYDGPGDVRTFDDGYDDDIDFYEYEDPENIVYGLHDLRYYNIGIEIPDHWNLFEVANDRSEFPARTYYSMWYNTWMNWVEISLFHDIGQKINLQDYDEGIRNYENYKRQWCEETKENPVFLDEPDESGWQTCLELKDFDFKKNHN